MDAGRHLLAGLSGIPACLVFAGLLAMIPSIAHGQPNASVHPSPMVPFEELFVPADTLVLDPSVTVGWIWFLDADASGSVLITDMQTHLAHLFAKTGRHVATFNMDVCLPSDFGHKVFSSRFAGTDRIILSTMKGAMAVFDRSGNCLAAKQGLINPLRSFCVHGGTIFAFRGPQGWGDALTSVVGVYSMELELQREILLEGPEFQRLNRSNLGAPGRDLDCFDDGPYYKYHEDMDARPALESSASTMSQPEFFVRRDRDISLGLSNRRRHEQMTAFPQLTGVYALDGDTRMMKFRIGEEFRSQSATGQFVTGLSIVSNSNQFTSVSTVPHEGPSTARHGYLYFVGENAPTDDGDLGNPTVIRYRFNVAERIGG